MDELNEEGGIVVRQLVNTMMIKLSILALMGNILLIITKEELISKSNKNNYSSLNSYVEDKSIYSSFSNIKEMCQ